MEQFFTLPFFVLEVPNMKLKRPTWLHQPSATTVFAAVLLSYFLVTGGEISLLLVVFERNTFSFNCRHNIRCNC